eukprot:scaffold103834_cov17-Tisochrysis_lutea.AAC.1
MPVTCMTSHTVQMQKSLQPANCPASDAHLPFVDTQVMRASGHTQKKPGQKGLGWSRLLDLRQ